MLKKACPEEILNRVQNDTFRIQHDRGIAKFLILDYGLWSTPGDLTSFKNLVIYYQLLIPLLLTSSHKGRRK